MPIDPRVTQKTRRSRSHPNLFQFDYLHIRHLVDDLKTAIETQLKGSALNILDVSCGSKPYEEFFSPYAGLYVGTDIRNHHYGLTDSISQTEFLPFKDNAFDVVISTQALHYFPHPERALSEMERVLKRSGQLIISIPGIWFYSPEVYEHRWTRPGLDRLFERFQHRKIVENGGIVTVIITLINGCVWILQEGMIKHFGLPGRIVCLPCHLLYCAANIWGYLAEKLIAPIWPEIFTLSMNYLVSAQNSKPDSESVE